MAESKKLPPTLGALKQHILRARVQARVWGQAAVPQQKLLDPLENGYHRDSDDGQLKLFMEAEEDVIKALCTLCDDADVSEDLQLTLAQFVCTALKHSRVVLAPVLQIHGRK